MRSHETALSRPVSIFSRLTAILTTFGAYFERRQLMRQLSDLDDHLLRDIGVTRQDVESALSGAFTHDPTVDLALRAHQSRAGRRAMAAEQRDWYNLSAEAEVSSAHTKVPQRAA